MTSEIGIPKWVKRQWWKYLSVLLLVYVLAGGLTVPLSPGLDTVSPALLYTDSVSGFQLKAINTHFKSGENIQVFVKAGRQYFCAENVQVGNENELSFSFSFNKATADSLHDNTFDVIVNDDKDGTLALREALLLVNREGDSSSAIKQDCEVAVKNNLYTGISFSYREILYESIRNVFYHVPMWFGMQLILIISLIYSIRYLSSGKTIDDIVASQAVNVSLLCAALGLLTGMMWANYTWGAPWPNDPKLNGAAVGVLIYLAYVVLRGAIQDPQKKARISAVYNIFALVIFVLFIFIIPRITDSLHPGNGGNPAFSKYDLDNHMRMFFYPAVIGWTLLFIWILSLCIRIRILELKKEENEE